ncbi:MAG: MarR family winged helix-turn-helix transcriptional regulator [Solirubrobacteraceae bacterium]
MSTTESATGRLSDLELAAWRGMLLTYASVSQKLDAQMRAEHGLSLSAYEVLMLLADESEQRMRMSDIAECVLPSRSGCTRLVDRLVEQGYVARCAAATDARGLYAQLTDAGLAKINAARATHHDGIRQFFLGHLTTTDQIVLGDIWTRFSGHSESEGGRDAGDRFAPADPAGRC